MSRWAASALCVAQLVLAAATAHGAAVLIPDHQHRLGSCGPNGAACAWDCRDDGGLCDATGPSCSAPATCALDATAAFRGVVTVKIDDSACATSDGAVLTIGLAGTDSNGMIFQIADKVIDLCERSMACTGREPRDCSACPGVCTDQCTDGTDCDCPPGPVVFMCKDPLATSDPFLREGDIANVVNWLAGVGGSQTIQPLMELIRNELAAVFPSATGRPVTVDASVQSLDEFADPPSGRFCVKVWFLRNDKPLGVCTDDPNDFCAGDSDCATGTCASGTPPDINPAEFTTVASGRKCSGSGKPCVVTDDCEAPQTCDATAASATIESVCSVAGTACTGTDDCPDFEDCVTCASALCGDGVVDPGEQCDDDNTTPGDGCSATCQNEGGACPATVDPTCVDEFTKGSLVVSEKTAGKERLVARLLNGPELAPSDFGDPVAGATAYHLCVYDDAGALVSDLTVDRAGDTCGDQPCWKGIGKPAGTKGFRYRDKALAADGVLLVLLRSGDAGKSKLIVREKGPTGAAAALAGATSATVQLRATDAPAPSCFSLATSVVTRNDGLIFKAKTP